MEDLLRSLQWRYSVQKFDESRKIPGDVWSTLEQALVLSPSSFGLQLWKFFVVTNQTVKDELRAASWNQAHVSQASHVVVLAARKDPNVADAERYLNRIAEVRGVPLATLEKLRNILTGFIKKPPARIDFKVWA
jgi:nitroreductase